jgi:hypothetical protein
MQLFNPTFPFNFLTLDIIFSYQEQIFIIFINTSCKYNLFILIKKIKINYNNLFAILLKYKIFFLKNYYLKKVNQII